MSLIDISFLQILLITVFIGSLAGYMGSLMVTKRMALMGGALGHLTLPGVALALRYGFDVSIGALLFLFVGIVLIWLFEQATKLPMEALTAVVFASSVATAFLFLPEEKQMAALIGDVSQVSLGTMIGIVMLCLSVFFLMRTLFKKLILISISPDLAVTTGVRVRLCQLLYLSCIALTVALGVRIVGGLMTAALLAIPACTSRNISRSLVHYVYGSLLLGGVASGLAVVLSRVTLVAGGPLIIIVSAILFFASVGYRVCRRAY